jgi:general secretion pathway protein D
MFIGGKDRRLVDIPVDEYGETPPEATVGTETTPSKSDRADQKVKLERADSISQALPKTEKFRGTGTFINEEVPPERVRIEPGGGSVTLNFVDADIRDVIKTVLGSTLGQNFAIDPNVKGMVTLQTSKPIPRSAVLTTLESALSLNGLSLIRTADLYRITSSKTAARNATRPRIAGMVGASGEAYGVEILPLEFAAATEMSKIIEPLAPSGAVIRTDSARNLLIVGGTRHERETISDIVTIFDVDWLSGMSFALVPLEFAQPSEAITDLERVFGTASGGPLEGLVRFFPVERRQSVLVISAKPGYIERARDWIKRLDIGGSDEKRLYVYSVDNARATDLATILSQVFSNGSGSVPSRSVAPEQSQARLTTRTPSTGGTTQNTVTAQAFGPPLSAAQASPAPASTPSRSGAAPRGRASTAPAPTAQATGSRNQTAVAGALPEELTARIIPDDVNNALVVMARPGVWRMIEEALRKLDVVPLQVMIEATIAEVTLNDDLRYGVQSFFSRGSSTAALSTLAGGTLAAPLAGFSFIYDQGNIQAILDALDSVTDIRVISSPQVLVVDNRTAELQVGDQVPITTQQSVSNTDATAPTVNSVQFRDTGVVLRVTPRVNASGVVNLEIEQEESSAVQTTSSSIDSPTIQQRKLRSTVVVNSGETIALGGLIRDTQTDAVSGIPLLSSIPFLGKLFSSTTETGRRTELLVLLTPRVIRNQEEARAVDLRKTLHNAAALKTIRK